MIFAVIQEALFQEMIEQTARQEGERCLVLGNEESIEAALQEEMPGLLLMDIGISTLDGPTFIEKLKQNPATRNIPLIVFGSSIRADLMQDARELGADQVLPKASFRHQLPEIIRRYQKK